MFAAVIIQGR